MDEFRFVGPTPTTLEGGRPIEPGEYTGPILASEVDEETGEPAAPANKILLDEGYLIPGSPPSEQQIEQSEKLTGKALDDRARELDIEGRSDMSADQLRTAISQVEGAGDKEKEGEKS